MSTRRTSTRKKAERQSKQVKNEESSSSESDYSRTLKIITKLSQKYLGTSERSKRCTRSSSTKSPDVAYDGDEENTSAESSEASSTASSKSKSSLYDFDEEDPEPVMKSVNTKNQKKQKSDSSRKTTNKNISVKPVSQTSSTNVQKKGETKMELSTKVASKNKSSVTKMESSLKVSSKNRISAAKKETNLEDKKKRTIKTRGVVMDISPIPNAVESTASNGTPDCRTGMKNVTFSLDISEAGSFSSTPVVALQKLELNSIENNQRQLRKRKCDSSSHSQSPKVVKRNQNQTKKENRDSGMFMSPGFVSQKSLRTRAVSTPCNSTFIPVKKSLQAYREPPVLDMSPVKTMSPVTPLSDYASMDSVTHKLSFDDADLMEVSSKNQSYNIELFTTEEEMPLNKSFQKTYKPSRKNKMIKKETQTNPKVDQWMEKMNTEFSEIEEFELSIEDPA